MKHIITTITIIAMIFCCYNALDYIGKGKYERYLAYVSMEKLLEHERSNVSRILQCGIADENTTIVIMDYCRFLLASGPAILVYDQSGVLIDATRDLGQDLRFEQKWRPSMVRAENLRLGMRPL